MKKISIISFVIFVLVNAFVFAGDAVSPASLIEKVVTLDFPNDKMPDVTQGWVGLSLESGATVATPQFDAPSWDLRFKQMYPGTNRAMVAKVELGKGEAFDAVKMAPTVRDAYALDVFEKPPGPGNERTFFNKKILEWCAYDLWSHACVPAHVVFVLRLADGRYAKLQITRYVKNGKEKGTIDSGQGKGPEYGKDNMVHITLRSKVNTVPGDLRLE